MIYLDNNATTAMDPRVAEAIATVYHTGPINASSQHRIGQHARQLLDEAIETIGTALGTDLTEPGGARLVLTSGGTESNNLALSGIGDPAAPLVISQIEHPSVSAMAEAMEAAGRPVRRLPVDSNGVAQVELLGELIGTGAGKASLVSLMSANNETGVLQPVERAAEICREFSVPLHVDASQSVGKTLLDVGRLGASAVTIAAHKFHGPAGIGALWLESGLQLRAMLRGGEQQLSSRPGTEPVALAVGMAEALRLAVQRLDESATTMQRLRDRLEQGLIERHPELVIHGAAAERLPNTSYVSLPGVDRQSMLMALDLAEIACSSGTACSSGSSPPSRVLKAMGAPPEQQQSALRFGVSRFSTADEIERAIGAISSNFSRLQRPASVEK